MQLWLSPRPSCLWQSWYLVTPILRDQCSSSSDFAVDVLFVRLDALGDSNISTLCCSGKIVSAGRSISLQATRVTRKAIASQLKSRSAFWLSLPSRATAARAWFSAPIVCRKRCSWVARACCFSWLLSSPSLAKQDLRICLEVGDCRRPGPTPDGEHQAPFEDLISVTAHAKRTNLCSMRAKLLLSTSP